MKPFKSSLLLLVISVLSFSACNDPLENVTEFSLIINNETETTYDVYEAADEFTGGAFRNVATIAPMESTTIRRLIIDVRYTFRLVPGDDPEQYDFQQFIQSAGDNITWTVP